MSKTSIFPVAGLLAALTLVFTSLAVAADNPEFPGRKLYPGVPVIEIDDLAKRLDEVVVVDVRSSLEYETLRVKGALNIPVSDKDFAEAVGRLRSETDKPIVFYCNGKTCLKSYKAAQACQKVDIPNVVAYDAGIMDWARAYPQQSELLGKSPVDPKRLISKKQFESHVLSPAQFADQVGQEEVIVLDMRDRFQREALSIFVGLERVVYLDDRDTLNRYIRKARAEKKPLLIYDAVGKQVQWLQYYLEDQGVDNYYFMKGGARGFFNYLAEQNLRSKG